MPPPFFFHITQASATDPEQIGQLLHHGMVDVLIDAVRKTRDNHSRLEAVHALGYLAMSYTPAYTDFLVQKGVIELLSDQLDTPEPEMVHRRRGGGGKRCMRCVPQERKNNGFFAHARRVLYF
jgi:hypothetical protein